MDQEVLSQKNIVVTGGAGFIGSHLVDQLLKRENKVKVIDDFSSGSLENLSQAQRNPNLTVVTGDIRDLALLQKEFNGTDIVFHLATNCVRLSLNHPMTNHEVNATGTLNTLIAARDQRVRKYLYCSSSEVYGNSILSSSASGKLLSEDSLKVPTTVYGASKLVGENYTLAFFQTYKLPALIVRPFNAYGPRSHVEGALGEVIPRFAAWILAGETPVIFGDGNQTRDFTYVEDTAKGLIFAASENTLLGNSVNLAHGEEVSVKQIVTLLCEHLKLDYRARHIGDRPGDIQRLGADTTKARSLFGAHALIPIRDGLERYLAWLSEQKIDFKKVARTLKEQNW